MSIFTTAHDTTVGGGFAIERTVRSIKEAYVQADNSAAYGIFDAYFKPVDSSIKLYPVTGESSDHIDIPFFNHPLVIKPGTKASIVAVDVRPFVTSKRNQDGSGSIRNIPEFELAIRRANLQIKWLDSDPRSMRDASTLPTTVYASWISETIARRYALDPKEQLTVAVIAAVFYTTLFSNTNTFVDEEGLAIRAMLAKTTKAPSLLLDSLMPELEEMSNIDEFASEIKKHINSPRLDDFNAGMLVSTTAGAWFGSASKEILGVALEHPPTFMALVVSALNEKAYKNAMLGNIALRYAGAKGGQSYIQTIDAMLSN